ncbi:Poly(A) polymerase central domain-containing protein [Paraphoma chrysanthemicola]|uniref:Poly(A) polymerase n=1 Tax=Paraphoma chrysanthemicola TaxID=798071 RepID=A0A8K0VSU9_9PLEO|nr:Poly(A) polymerase central domain-containing protein [Paraphoma chrysanthemicola]
MDEKKKPQWGTTAAISDAPPTAADNKLNDELIETLTRMNVFETPDGNKRREMVLAHVQKVVEEFVRRASKQKGLKQSVVDAAGGKIFFFGSYALGVHGPTSDIDTLIVVPKHVFIEDFFKQFPSVFRELSDVQDITELVPVEDAFVPIIKMEYRGVSLDILFASMPTMASVPRDLETVDKSVLKHLDETTIRSVNGTRVVKELLASVPQHRHFRYALRAVKLWANRRGIYGAVFGFPGGIAWAIMVARICQLYPMACGATILAKFFNLMHKWNWPRPVMLTNHETEGFGLRVWNPAVYSGDARHLMPVITPAFPAMCATHTITPSTKQIMMNEFVRADQIVRDVYAGLKSWERLFDRTEFFTKDHKYYLSVVAASRSKEDDLTFHGLVQSKVRILVSGIDDGNTGISIARPFTEGYERIHRCKNEDQVFEVTKGSLDYMISPSDVPEPGTTEDHIMYTTTFYIGIQYKDATKLDISYPAAQFKSKVEESNLYNKDTMSVRVVHARNTQLPDDVFMPGEIRPAKSKKSKTKENGKETKKSKDSKSGAKRPFNETGLDVGDQRHIKSPKH